MSKYEDLPANEEDPRFSHLHNVDHDDVVDREQKHVHEDDHYHDYDSKRRLALARKRKLGAVT
jgi:hypothetical protein